MQLDVVDDEEPVVEVVWCEAAKRECAAPKASGWVSAKRELRSSRKAPRENINRRSFSKTAQRVAKVRQPKVKLGNLQLTFVHHQCGRFWYNQRMNTDLIYEDETYAIFAAESCSLLVVECMAADISQTPIQ